MQFQSLALAAGWLALALTSGQVRAAVPPPTPHGAVPSARQLKWARDTDLYGMVNFSTITYFSKEWGYGDEDPAKFHPTDFDARQIVGSAKAGGLKGLVIDAKHHGGFCLWPSKVNDNYSVKNSPWKNGKGDMLRELVDACHAEGLKVGIYLSPWDRNHKNYGTPAYLEYYEAQLTELLTQYGPVFEVWLDGANGGDGYYGGARTTRRVDQQNYYPIRKWFELIRRHQPEALIFSDCGPDVRWNGNEHGVSGEHSNGTCWGTTHQRPWASGNTGQLNRGDRDGTLYNPAEADFPLLAKAWFWNPNTRTRTPGELVNLYFTSIGRNSAMDIGIAPDTRGRISDRDAASLKGFGDRIKAIFAKNLASIATVTASNVRGNDSTYAATQVLNGWSAGHYWASDDAALTPELVMDFGKPTEFSVISLREHIALGERVDDWALDAWQDGAWKEFAAGTCIGARRLWRGQPVISDKIRLRITKAAACPAIAEFAVYLEPEASRKEAGKAIGVRLERGLPKKNWKIVSATSEGAPAANAIDENPATLWHTHTAAGRQPPPQEIVVDMGRELELTGFLYLPRQDGNAIGNVDRYTFHLSADGKTWGEAVATGGFSNIINSPDPQKVMFAKPVNGRYFKLVALHAAVGDCVCAAEIGVLGSGPKSGAAALPTPNTSSKSPPIAVGRSRCLRRRPSTRAPTGIASSG